MKHPFNWIRLICILASSLCVLLFESSVASLILILISLAILPFIKILPARNRRLLYFIPGFFLLVSFRLIVIPPIQPIPEILRDFIDERINYRRSLIADVSVIRTISPGKYLARVEIDRSEVRIFDKKYKKYNQYKRNKKRNVYSGHGKNRKYKSFRRPPYQRYRWIIRRRFKGEKDGTPFTALLSLNDKKLYRGCNLTLRLYGRGVPKRVSPGSSYSRYLIKMGASTSIRVSRKYHVMDSSCPEPGIRWEIRRRIQSLITDRSGMTANASGVALGMIFGQSGFMKGRFRFIGSCTGIMHLFAASGLHLGIFYLMFYFPLSRFFGKRHPVSLIIPLIFSGAYIWFLDFPVSLIRACGFALFASLRGVVHRRLTEEDILLNASMLMILIDPRGAIGVSGGMSMGAVGGILLFYKTVRTKIFPWSGPPFSWLASQISLSVCASTIPSFLVAAIFGIHSFSGILSNVIFVPMAGLILPVLYCTVILDLLHLPYFISDYFLGLATVLLEFFVAALELFSPYSLARNGFHTLNITILWITPLLILLALMRIQKKNRENRKTVVLLRTGIVVSLFFSTIPGGLVLREMESMFPSEMQSYSWFFGRAVSIEPELSILESQTHSGVVFRNLLRRAKEMGAKLSN